MNGMDRLFDPNDYSSEEDLPQYHKPIAEGDIKGVILADITRDEIRNKHLLGGESPAEFSDNLIRQIIREIYDIYKTKDEKKEFSERMFLISRFFELENLLEYSEKNLNDYFLRNNDYSKEDFDKIREELRKTKSIS